RECENAVQVLREEGRTSFGERAEKAPPSARPAPGGPAMAERSPGRRALEVERVLAEAVVELEVREAVRLQQFGLDGARLRVAVGLEPHRQLRLLVHVNDHPRGVPERVRA